MMEVEEILETIQDATTREQVRAFYMSHVGKGDECPHTWMQHIEEKYERCIGCMRLFQES